MTEKRICMCDPLKKHPRQSYEEVIKQLLPDLVEK